MEFDTIPYDLKSLVFFDGNHCRPQTKDHNHKPVFTQIALIRMLCLLSHNVSKTVRTQPSISTTSIESQPNNNVTSDQGNKIELNRSC